MVLLNISFREKSSKWCCFFVRRYICQQSCSSRRPIRGRIDWKCDWVKRRQRFPRHWYRVDIVCGLLGNCWKGTERTKISGEARQSRLHSVGVFSVCHHRHRCANGAKEIQADWS